MPKPCAFIRFTHSLLVFFTSFKKSFFENKVSNLSTAEYKVSPRQWVELYSAVRAKPEQEQHISTVHNTVDASMNEPLRTMMIIYFDGGCSPNPGQMEAAVVVKPPVGKPEAFHFPGLGYGTSNIAEWSAVLAAMTIAIDLEVDSITLLGDSQLVVNQASGVWKVKNQTFIPFKEQFDQLSKGIDVNLVHVGRAKNLAGCFLEKGHL